MTVEYWYLFPVGVLIATIAMAFGVVDEMFSKRKHA